MKIEQTGSSKPNFMMVVYTFAAAIVIIILGAIVILSWRGKKNLKPPFTAHPTSLLSAPADLSTQPAQRLGEGKTA